MAKANIFRPDGSSGVLVSANGKFSLEELQTAVGGYIELVPIRSLTGDFLVVDEDGLSKELPLNNDASAFANKPIVGTALLIQSKDID